MSIVVVLLGESKHRNEVASVPIFPEFGPILLHLESIASKQIPPQFFAQVVAF